MLTIVKIVVQAWEELPEFMWHCQPHHCTQDAIKWAASSGQLEMVKWLCEKELTGSTQEAIEEAASMGHEDIVQHLVSLGLVRCVGCVMTKALQNGELSLVEWLDSVECGGEACEQFHVVDSWTCLNATAKNASGRGLVKKGGVAALEWLMARFGTLELDGAFLVLASSAGVCSVVRWILERMKLDEATLKKAVQDACEAGHLEVVKLFVGRGHGPASLDTAVTSGNVELVRFLQQVYGDLLEYSTQSLDLAAHDGYVDMVQYLYPTYVCYLTFSTCPAYNASSKGSLAMIQFIFSNGLSRRECFHALRGAIRSGHFEIVEFVYCEVKRMGWWGQECLTFERVMSEMNDAAKKNDFRAIEFLVAREELEEDADFWFVIHRAISSRYFDLIKLLWDKNAKGFTVEDFLADAALLGSLRLVRFLYQQGVFQSTTKALKYAAARGNLRVVEFLHYETQLGCTAKAMDCAADGGHLGVVRFLHSHREEGCTSQAVCLAAKRGHLEVVKFLLRYRTESNAREALRAAYECGQVAVVQWLVNDFGEAVDDELWDLAKQNRANLAMAATMEFLKSPRV